MVGDGDDNDANDDYDDYDDANDDDNDDNDGQSIMQCSQFGRLESCWLDNPVDPREGTI